MKLKQLGEEKLVAWIKQLAGERKGTVLGIGDDSAVVRIGQEYIVLTSDMIQEKTHIYDGMSHFQAGRKVAVCNFSDLAAMGAEPVGFLFSLGIDDSELFQNFKEIFRGVETVCAEVGATFLGGDMNKSQKLVLSGFAIGKIEKKHLMTRKGAQAGDIVAVTGHIGSSACGWKILEKRLPLEKFPEEEREKIEGNILSASLMPEARVKEGRILAKSGYVTSCIDITDGLAISLKYLQNDCGFWIDEDRIPVRREIDWVCDKFGLDKDEIVYRIGEDFELLCTIRPQGWEYLKKRIKGLNEIGRVTEGNRVKLKRGDGRVETLRLSGYNHFEG
ncbi:MAG: thiamine-phosphate kinase [Candidatus Altiarchaeota archaeon]|nr:thiamine-phosphate kinase [Candidatus Altiarchaeota archaeon]